MIICVKRVEAVSLLDSTQQEQVSGPAMPHYPLGCGGTQLEGAKGSLHRALSVQREAESGDLEAQAQPGPCVSHRLACRAVGWRRCWTAKWSIRGILRTALFTLLVLASAHLRRHIKRADTFLSFELRFSHASRHLLSSRSRGGRRDRVLHCAVRSARCG